MQLADSQPNSITIRNTDVLEHQCFLASAKSYHGKRAHITLRHPHTITLTHTPCSLSCHQIMVFSTLKDNSIAMQRRSQTRSVSVYYLCHNFLALQ